MLGLDKSRCILYSFDMRDNTTAHGRAERAFDYYMSFLFDKAGAPVCSDNHGEWAGLIEDIIAAAVDAVRADLATQPQTAAEAAPITVFDQDSADSLYSLALTAHDAVSRLFASASILSHIPADVRVGLKAIEALTDLKGALNRYDDGLPQRHQEAP